MIAGICLMCEAPILLRPVKTITRLVTVMALFSGTVDWLAAAPTGPTLHLDYGQGRPLENPASQFMYFVPLISPDPISVSTNAGNTQYARVISCKCQTNGASFHATCEFAIDGEGEQQNVFDHTDCIRQHEKELKAGKPLRYQLDAINVQGSGSGSVEIEGTLTDGWPAVTEVLLRFNGHGRISPVTISLHDIVYRRGAIHFQNGIVARVNALVFRRKSGVPQMEVILASLKPEEAGDGTWQNFIGRVRGVAANLLIPPLAVPADGHQAMMDFGLALATKQASFTFPFATRLKKPEKRAAVRSEGTNSPQSFPQLTHGIRKGLTKPI
ncbi:MAG TPA: hypothetical protein VMH30_03535 [Verrucomicrobiae bacterium]|nr:hypothetical protein [Verrucomicrobiae bacterium]